MHKTHVRLHTHMYITAYMNFYTVTDDYGNDSTMQSLTTEDSTSNNYLNTAVMVDSIVLLTVLLGLCLEWFCLS